MKKLLMFAGAIGLLALGAHAPARADVFVDKPSLGRIVWGLSGGDIILPADAWIGYYPDDTSNTALAGDDLFGGSAVVVGGKTLYSGDTVNAGANFGYDYAWALTQTANATQVNTLLAGSTLTSGSNPSGVFAAKLALISTFGKDSEVDVRAQGSGVLKTLFNAASNVGDTASVTVGDPFGLVFRSTGAVSNPFYADSQDLTLNSGSAANKLYNHFKIYQIDAMPNVYIVGMEDWNYDTSGTGHRRFDWNDTVIAMQVVPEPAFYQMAGFLGLGAFGLLRLRRRTTK